MNGNWIVNTYWGDGSGQNIDAIQYDADERYPWGWFTNGALEFDVSKLNGPVHSAFLSLYVSYADRGYPYPVGPPGTSASFNVSGNPSQGPISQYELYGSGQYYARTTISGPVNWEFNQYVVNLDVTSLVNSAVSQGLPYVDVALWISESEYGVDNDGPTNIYFAQQPQFLPTITIDGPAPFTAGSIPEPASLTMLALGFLGVTAAVTWRRRCH